MSTQAQKLRDLANALTPAIQAKRSPSTQRMTARRARQADNAAVDADRLERIQRRLVALAEAHEVGLVPAALAKVKNRAVVEDLVRGYFPLSEDDPTRKRLEAAGFADKAAFGAAREALTALVGGDRVAPPEEVALAQAERALIGCSIPGYFPTPPAVVAELLALAELAPGMSVLEPSAGKGDIAVAARAAGGVVTCCEIQHSLIHILTLKGFTVLEDDFLSLPTNLATYDRVLMNPPFEKGADMDHVQHAWAMLKPGGRLVAIVSEGAFSRSGRKELAFREWLRSVGGASTPVAAGAFYASDRPTGVATRILVIDR